MAIYAIKAVGTEFVKIGVTRDGQVGRRLASHQVSCPFELELIAIAGWPDTAERQIHHYLAELRERGEWFREGERLSHVLRLMADKDGGLDAFIAVTIPAKKQRKKSLMHDRRKQRLRQLEQATKRAFGRVGPKLGSKLSP